ncbi:MAG: DMT family transporter [Candidatus Hadarchaeum sp.]|uniref:DMT family transporter n=1 Tax=Candidatus Hadarchaeum sp. TaxID=2883567 RepID=UPI003D0F8D8B
MDVLSIALAVLTALFWSLSQIMGKVLMKEMNPTYYSTLRLVIAVIVFTPLVLINGLRITADSLPIVALDGVLGMALGILIYFYCMKRAPAHKIIPVGNSYPIWAMVLALVLLREPFSIVLPISIALIMAGVLLLVQRKKERRSNGWWLAVPLTTLVAALYGLDLVLRKMAVNLRTDVTSFVWVSLVVAASVLVLATLFTRSWSGQNLGRKNLSLVFFSSLFGHILGTIVFMWALESESLTSLAPFVSLSIPFGFIFSVLFIEEKPSLKSVFGMALVFLSVVLVAL